MTLFIPDGYAQLVYGFSIHGSSHTASVSMGLAIDDTPNLPQMAEDLGTAWWDHMGPGALSDGWDFSSSEVRTADQVGRVEFTLDGSNSSDTSPPNLAAICKKITAFTGRKNRGRFYIPAGYIPEGEVEFKGDMTPTLRDDLQANIEAWATDLLAVDQVIGMRILHTNEDDLPTVITQLAVQSLCATQRRRMR